MLAFIPLLVLVVQYLRCYYCPLDVMATTSFCFIDNIHFCCLYYLDNILPFYFHVISSIFCFFSLYTSDYFTLQYDILYVGDLVQSCILLMPKVINMSVMEAVFLVSVDDPPECIQFTPLTPFLCD